MTSFILSERLMKALHVAATARPTSVDVLLDVLSALNEASGMVSVPVEPTPEMLNAGAAANVGPRSTVPAYIYEAMISRRPID